MTRQRLVVLAAALVVLAGAALVWAAVDEPRGVAHPSANGRSAAATASTHATPASSPDETSVPVPGSDVAWWDTGDFGFGTTGFEPEPVPAAPQGYRQLRVGTLDGRITAVRTLPDGWSESYVSGPVDGDVLVVADDGQASIVSTITAATGAEEVVLESQRIIPAAVLSPDGTEIWYIALQRPDGSELGLFRRPRVGGEGVRVLAEPLGEPFDDEGITVWQLHFDPDGRWLVIQWCFGEVRCTTHVLDTETGDRRSTERLGWPWGFTDSLLVARGVAGGPVMAIDLASGDEIRWNANLEVGVVVEARGSWWVVGAPGFGNPTHILELVRGATPQELPGDASTDTTEFRIPLDAGVGPLPPGWALRHPNPLGTWPEDGAHVAQGELVDVSSGARRILPAFAPVLTEPDCAIVGPTVTPNGRPSGFNRSELRDGARFVQWSSGEDVVTLVVGVPILGRLDDLEDMPATTVRGRPARVVPIGDDGVGEIALVWEEAGCTYTAYLAAGTTLDAALDYASRY